MVSFWVITVWVGINEPNVRYWVMLYKRLDKRGWVLVINYAKESTVHYTLYSTQSQFVIHVTKVRRWVIVIQDSTLRRWIIVIHDAKVRGWVAVIHDAKVRGWVILIHDAKVIRWVTVMHDARDESCNMTFHHFLSVSGQSCQFSPILLEM